MSTIPLGFHSYTLLYLTLTLVAVAWLAIGVLLLRYMRTGDVLAMVSYGRSPAFEIFWFLALVIAWPLSLVAWLCLVVFSWFSYWLLATPAELDERQVERELKRFQKTIEKLNAGLVSYTEGLKDRVSERSEQMRMQKLLYQLDLAYQQALHSAILLSPTELAEVSLNCAFSEATLLKFRRHLALNVDESEIRLYPRGSL